MKTNTIWSIVTLSLISLFLITCGLAASAQDQVTPQPASSAVPNLIRYSGLLKDTNNVPLASQTVGVIFSLYKDAAGGAAVWSETRNLTTTATGQYTVLLGGTKTEGLPAAVFSDEEQRWLGVQVQGQSEQPRVLLVSVPYAFKAHEAETLGGLPPSAFVKFAPDATSSASAAANNSSATNASSGTANGTASGTANSIKPLGGVGPVFNYLCPSAGNPAPYYIPRFVPSPGPLTPASVICNSVIYQSPAGPTTGFVGIGTTNPSTQLEVNGAITADQWYDITSQELPFLSVGWPTVIPANQNTWLGLGAGGQGINLTDTGTLNTFTGYNAGYGNTKGYQNSCFGSAACLHNLTGIQNVAVGAGAGFRNTDGNANVYVGFDAGWGAFIGSHGSDNTMVGFEAGFNNTADGNSFFGYQAGYDTTSGVNNTYLGNIAGAGNSTGSNNTSVGTAAGLGGGSSNVSIGVLTGYTSLGGDNVVIGHQAALGGAGSSNVIIGAEAVFDSPVGDGNTFIGAGVDYNSQLGSRNIFIGYHTGTQGSIMNNIYLDAQCNRCDLDNPENNTIRIGTQGRELTAYFAGIYPNGVPNTNPVCVTPNGLLGVCSSSQRFKEDIREMGDSTNNLMQLRPVTYLYRPEYDKGQRSLQYGLIAEEVARVYPDLVAYEPDGTPLTVNYQNLSAMLLNEFQKQHAVVTAQQQQMLAQQHEIESLKSQLQLQNAAFQQRLSRLESLITSQLQTAADKSTPATTPATGGLQ